MKRLIPALLCLALCLCACGPAGNPPTHTTEPPASSTMSGPVTEPETAPTAPTETAPEPETAPVSLENSAYAPYSGLCPGDLGIMLNEYFADAPEATVIWREGNFDRAYIIPRYVGSYVNLYSVLWQEDGSYTLGDKAVQSTRAEDGTAIYSVLERPEGQAQWYLEIVAPDGRSFGMLLEYNGRTGSPARECLAEAPSQAEGEALLSLLGPDYAWALEESRTLIDGVPYVNFRLTRQGKGGGGSYVCNALIDPGGEMFAAALNPDTDRWELRGALDAALEEAAP